MPGDHITTIDALIIAYRNQYDPDGYITLAFAILFAGGFLFLLWRAPKEQF
jgi:hypothetical protein